MDSRLKKPLFAFALLVAGALAALAATYTTWQQQLKQAAEDTAQKKQPQSNEDFVAEIIAHSDKMAVKKPRPTPKALNKNPEYPRWVTNALPALDVKPGQAVVAIVIDDMGVAGNNSANALNLPKNVTLSFLPYGDFTLKHAFQARVLGHEVMIHLPMEPAGFKDDPTVYPGPNALYVDDGTAKIKDKIYKNLNDLADIAVGVNNHMGSAFTSHQAGMTQVLNILNEQKLLFMDSITTPNSSVTAAAKSLSLTIPVLKRDVFIDHYMDQTKVEEALTKLEQVAKDQGYAIGIGHPYPMTVNAITQWAKGLEDRGVKLVPITHMVKYYDPKPPTP